MTLKLGHEGWVKINQGKNWGKDVLETIDLADLQPLPLRNADYLSITEQNESIS